MFQVTSEMIEKLKDALRLQPVPAVNGPQIYYACSACMGTCKNSCSVIKNVGMKKETDRCKSS